MLLHHHLPAARYSEAVVVNGFVFLSGQVPTNPEADIEAQTADVLAQIDRILADCGSDKAHICEAVIYLPDMADYAGMNRVWDAAPVCRPRWQMRAGKWKSRLRRCSAQHDRQRPSAVQSARFLFI